jgi:hypothetical protein
MKLKRRRQKLGPALLWSESPKDYEASLEELKRDLQPRSVIMRMFVEDYAKLTWEIARYDRAIVALLNAASPRALTNVLRPIFFGPAKLEKGDAPARDLAEEAIRFSDGADRALKLLNEVGLDETAVEAEALRLRSDDIEGIQRLRTTAETRRDKVLGNIAFYDKIFAERLQSSAEQVLAADDVPAIAPPVQEVS